MRASDHGPILCNISDIPWLGGLSGFFVCLFCFPGVCMFMFVHIPLSVRDSIHMHTFLQFILGGEYVQ